MFLTERYYLEMVLIVKSNLEKYSWIKLRKQTKDETLKHQNSSQKVSNEIFILERKFFHLYFVDKNN